MRFLFFITIYFVFGTVHCQPILHFDFEDDQFSITTTEKITNSNFNIKNHFNKPERIASPKGKALRLDGWSTYIEKSNYSINDITNALSIEVVYATEAFTQKPAAIIDFSGTGNELYLAVDPFGKIIFSYKINGQNYAITSATSIKPYEWNHIVATIDPSDNTANIYINSVLVSTKQHAEINFIQTAPSPLLIGKRNAVQDFNGFSLNTLNGAIDDIKIYNKAISDDEINATFTSLGVDLSVDLAIDLLIRHANDYLRPKYHVMPNTFWANETYGLIYYDHKYHLFFQKNPNGPYLYFMHWGHFSSPDLVEWKEEKMALRPQPGFSSFGKWSGSTVANRGGIPQIVFTGVDGIKAGIGMASPKDHGLIDWEETSVAAIPNPPLGLPNKDFRDPYIWKEGDTYWMIVGSGVANDGGGVLFTYTSSDLIQWTNVTPIYKNNDIANAGIFWEMPYFNRITDTDYLLVVTPQYKGKPANCIYWVGSFDGSSFTPYDSMPKDFEMFNERLLAPSIGIDENGQLMYIGIIPEDRNQGDQVKAGWRQTFSVPRGLRLLKDRKTLAQVPHQNLCRSRKNKIQVKNRIIQPNTNFNVPEYKGNQSEIDALFFAKNVDQFTIQVLKNDSGNELTSIVFDLKNNRIGMNRFLSSPYDTKKDLLYKEYEFRGDDTVSVRIFVDHSTLEVFVDQLVVMSSRVYPSENSINFDIISPLAELEIVYWDAYDMETKEKTFENIVCPTTILPESLFSKTMDISNKYDSLEFFPNPSNTNNFKALLPTTISCTNMVFKIFDMNGNLIEGIKTQVNDNLLDVNIPQNITAKILFLHLHCGDQKYLAKLLIHQ